MSSLKRFLPVIGGALAGGAIALAVSSGSTTHSSTTTVVQPAGNSSLPTSLSSGKGQTINQIYKNDAPGVVDILVTQKSSGSSLAPLISPGSKQEGEGAGVVYDKKGDIVTDQHVVANATSVKVTFNDGQTAPAKVLGTDSSTDTAVIHVTVPSSELHPIPFANSTSAQVGDAVVAIGSPFSLPETVTAGIVSQTGRSIEAPNGFTVPGAIQTDAAINPGNSGGPLLDAAGDVLGLNDQIETNNQTAGGEGSSSGVGFAIPSSTVQRISNGIIGGNPIQHAYVGVSLAPDTGGGAKIASQETGAASPIAPGSPAAAAGLEAGDVITAINGKTVTSTDQFIAMIDTYSPGDSVTLTVQRGGQSKQVKLKLTNRPASAPGQTQIP
jgi:S1-C subfamily serine protease